MFNKLREKLKNWTKKILEVVDNISNEREKSNGKAYEFALDQDVDRHAEEIADMYREIALTHAHIGFGGE